MLNNSLKCFYAFVNSIHSITSDNGCEFAAHKLISEQLETEFYFANPYTSWERGLSENANKLVKQYIPKGTNFSKITPEQIKEIQYKINRRPRKNLNFNLQLKCFLILVSQDVALVS